MSTSPAPRLTGPAVGSLLVALALTGCGSDADDGSDTPEEPPPSAADGTDYTACDDGTCEVAVSERTEFVFGEMTLTITAVTEDGIETRTYSPGGGVGSGSLSGGYCVSYMTPNGATASCYGEGDGEPPEPDPAAGELALELLDVTDGTAIIRLTMG